MRKHFETCSNVTADFTTGQLLIPGAANSPLTGTGDLNGGSPVRAARIIVQGQTFVQQSPYGARAINGKNACFVLSNTESEAALLLKLVSPSAGVASTFAEKG